MNLHDSSYGRCYCGGATENLSLGLRGHYALKLLQENRVVY